MVNFPAMCSELIRVLKPGGMLAASLNLDEPPTAEEPQQLNEAAIGEHLLDRLEIQSYRCVDKTGTTPSNRSSAGKNDGGSPDARGCSG